MKKLMILLTFLLMAACSDDYQKEFTLSGQVSSIDFEKKLISIDGQPIIVDNPSDFEIGLKLKITLIDHTSEDDWDPNDFEVIKIERVN